MTDTKQPEALRLAEYFGKFWGKNDDEYKAAAELRRLHEVNAELLEALKVLAIAANRMCHSSLTSSIYQARAAIAKATGEQA